MNREGQKYMVAYLCGLGGMPVNYEPGTDDRIDTIAEALRRWEELEKEYPDESPTPSPAPLAVVSVLRKMLTKVPATGSFKEGRTYENGYAWGRNEGINEAIEKLDTLQSSARVLDGEVTAHYGSVPEDPEDPPFAEVTVFAETDAELIPMGTKVKVLVSVEEQTCDGCENYHRLADAFGHCNYLGEKVEAKAHKCVDDHWMPIEEKVE